MCNAEQSGQQASQAGSCGQGSASAVSLLRSQYNDVQARRLLVVMTACDAHTSSNSSCCASCATATAAAMLCTQVLSLVWGWRSPMMGQQAATSWC